MAPLIQDDYDILSLGSIVDNNEVGGGGDDHREESVGVLHYLPLHDESFSTIDYQHHHQESYSTLDYKHTLPPRQPRRRVVSFGAVNTTHEIIHRDDYTPAEISAAWYGREEMRAMKAAAKSDARLADAGEQLLPRGFTLRGLEGRTREGMRRKTRNRREAYVSVFSEVAFQREVGYHDDELIADACFLYSEGCAEEAHRAGQRDEVDAHRSDEDDSLFDVGFRRDALVERLTTARPPPQPVAVTA